MAETARYAPWPLPEPEETAALFGENWQPYGLETNWKMLNDFCQDQFAQRPVSAPVDPTSAFADFTRLMQA
jgi:4,5-dihydroxyphthalate decarboxylase